MGNSTLVLASNNEHKLKEFRSLLSPEIEVLSLNEVGFDTPMPEEGTESYQANAEQKAEFVGKKLQKLCLGDDSGFEVKALDGAPGIISARYGDTTDSKTQRKLILEKMSGSNDRTAAFVCVLALYLPDQASSMVFAAKTEGSLSETEKGSAGFGYDPIFVPNGFDRTFAELSPEEKNKVSHRAMAVKLLKKYLLA